MTCHEEILILLEKLLTYLNLPATFNLHMLRMNLFFYPKFSLHPPPLTTLLGHPVQK